MGTTPVRRTMRLIITTFVGIICGFFLGVSFPTLPLTKIGVPTNPRGANRLPPDVIVAESDLYTRRSWGLPTEDLIIKPRYLITFAVGYDQKNNIDAAVKKLTENFTILLFHYDGRTSEWDEFEWSKRAIHVSVRKQTKWWYAKRFLHPDIVAPYDYIFVWDEDLGIDNFDAEEYIKLVRKHELDISQPGLCPDSGTTWKITQRREDTEVHKDTEETPGLCTDPHLPPCAAFVEIMAPVFSRDAWRCVWHMIQGKAEKGKTPWEGVRERCEMEWAIFEDRMNAAIEAMGIETRNSTARYANFYGKYVRKERKKEGQI